MASAFEKKCLKKRESKERIQVLDFGLSVERNENPRRKRVMK